MKSLLFTTLLFLPLLTIGQDLNSQFDSLKNNSETFKDYKVIKIITLNNFWATVQDSIEIKQAVLADYKQKEQVLETSIKDLELKEEELTQHSETLKYASTNIDFLGIDFSKTVFKVTFSIIVVFLILVIGFLFIQLKRKLQVANSSKQELTNVEEEFDTYKKLSLEKERKLRRELQTERNRLNEIRSI